MKAMILSAGFGKRLRPLTDTTPKALIELGGLTMLEIALAKLKAAGVDSVIINVHHFAEKIESFLAARKFSGLKITLSSESPSPLETGGGLKKASWFFDDKEPFFLYNSDVITNLDLSAIYKKHLAGQALATLAVKNRPTARHLGFDSGLNLQGRYNASRPQSDLIPLAFNGIQVISADLLPLMTETGIFSIIEVYLRLVSCGYTIKGFRMDDCYWQDIGTVEKLSEARMLMSEHPALIERGRKILYG